MSRKTGWADPFDKRAAKFSGFGNKAFGGRSKTPKSFEPKTGRLPDLEDDELERMLYRLKDATLVKRVRKLRGQWPNATLPELVTMDFLLRRGIRHVFQAGFGKSRTGGFITPDFVVQIGPGMAAVWEVQGGFWHTKHKTPDSDRRRSAYFMNRSYQGMKIVKYVELWESRIYSQNPQVFEAALSGFNLGR